MHLFTYNGKSSGDFGVVISGQDTWKKASPDLERVTIPGRNGELILTNKRYNNVDIPYKCGIIRNFDVNFTGFINHLLADPGYHRLEDSYHPEVYRMAVFDAQTEPDMTALNAQGEFNITFSCKPQMYLKSGELKQEAYNGNAIYNPTRQEARPLIRVYGTGELVVGSDIVRINECNSYTDLDCELQEAYKEQTNCNDNIELDQDDFPSLVPGRTIISWSGGIYRVEVTPRWWML